MQKRRCLSYTDFSWLPYKWGGIVGRTNLGIYPKGKLLTWTGRLNKCNNGFLLWRWLKVTHTPLAGARLSVERPVTECKLDLAGYEVEQNSSRDMASLSLPFPSSCLFPALSNGKTKDWKEWKVFGVFCPFWLFSKSVFVSIIGFLGAVCSLLPFMSVNSECS